MIPTFLLKERSNKRSKKVKKAPPRGKLANRKDRNMSNERLRVECGEGKYTLIQEADGRLHALRYGDPWRECVGDGLILALGCDLEAAKATVAEQGKTIDAMRAAAVAYQDLAICYRCGISPSEALFNRITKAIKTIGANNPT